MKEIPVNSWEELLEEIYKLEPNFGPYKSVSDFYYHQVLYRGQSDSEWPLKSTLERRSSKKWSIEDYNNLSMECIPIINSLIGQNWDRNQFFRKDAYSLRNEFWIYLRHCGFPSPLLDWTISPYKAAFFAFEEKINVDKVAIFALIGRPDNLIYSINPNSPCIDLMEARIKTHNREYLQQSVHTYCKQKIESNDIFIPHEETLEALSNLKGKEFLIKFIIPRSERFKALSYLDKFNINHYSLFQTEEALMQTLAFREIDSKLWKS